jgi:hypothetical protein
MTRPAARRRFWPAELIALGVALGASVALIIVAITAPFYSSSFSARTSTGVVARGSSSATLIEEYGAGVLVIVTAPLIITLAILAMLWLRGVERGPGPLVWTTVGLLAALTLAGLLTIGIFILPTTACLITARTLRQTRRAVG